MLILYGVMYGVMFMSGGIGLALFLASAHAPVAAATMFGVGWGTFCSTIFYTSIVPMLKGRAQGKP